MARGKTLDTIMNTQRKSINKEKMTAVVDVDMWRVGVEELIVPCYKNDNDMWVCFGIIGDEITRLVKSGKVPKYNMRLKTVKAPWDPIVLKIMNEAKKVGIKIKKKKCPKCNSKSYQSRTKKRWPRKVDGHIYNSYNTYLHSAWWQNKRKTFEDKYEQRCGYCESTCDKPNLHHLTYERLGCERDEDLVWMCQVCHEYIHKLKSDRQPELKRFPK